MHGAHYCELLTYISAEKRSKKGYGGDWGKGRKRRETNRTAPSMRMAGWLAVLLTFGDLNVVYDRAIYHIFLDEEIEEDYHERTGGEFRLRAAGVRSTGRKGTLIASFGQECEVCTDCVAMSDSLQNSPSPSHPSIDNASKKPFAPTKRPRELALAFVLFP